jgi:protocatechuate 3,4-dioxygenase beta subunit
MLSLAHLSLSLADLSAGSARVAARTQPNRNRVCATSLPSRCQLMTCAMKIVRLLTIFMLSSVMSDFAAAQAPSGKGTIRGSATSGGQPLPGIVLELYRDYLSRVEYSGSTETDDLGKYQFNQVPPGKYAISPLSPQLVPEDDDPRGVLRGTVVVGDGGMVENVALLLKRGGVVTGRITDAKGYPVTGHKVSYERLNSEGQVIHSTGRRYFEGAGITDDRGVYRLFGLYSGRYRIYLGDRSRPRGLRPPYFEIPPLTFYPGTRDVTRAEILEVKAGSEVDGVDITLANERTFDVIGRVIDAQTGAPVPNVQVGFQTTEGFSPSEMRTNDRGEFRYEGFLPGQYSFYAFLGPESEQYSDQTSVEVKEGNVEGVIIKVYRGINVSGWVTIEGRPDPAVLKQIPGLGVWAVPRSQKQVTPKNAQQRIDADGSFIFKGLEPGKYWFRMFNMASSPLAVNLVRIENRGVTGQEIEITPGKNLTDVRLVIAFGVGTIRGRVQASTESIELPANAYLQITARPKQNFFNGYGVARADQRGNFVINGMAPGEYELSVAIDFDQQPAQRNIFTRQNSRVVTVKGDNDTDIVLPVEFFKQERR